MAPETTKRAGLNCVQRELVARHLRLVRLHLRTRVFLPKTATRDRETEDLYQEGCLGLMRAAMSYDASRHGRFEPYALARIRGAVHTAIHERFATVRIPLRMIERSKAMARQTGGGDVCGLGGQRAHCTNLGDTEYAPRRIASTDGMEHSQHRLVAGDSGIDTVSRHLRAKLRIALAAAVERTGYRCRRAGTRAVLEAIAAERLAVPEEQERTALRAISRRFGVSTGRAVAWQRGLEREARGLLAADEEFGVLRDALAQAGKGHDRPVDAGLTGELARARAGTFARGFASRDPGHQAIMLATMLRYAGRDVSQEAAAVFASLPCERQREILTAMNAPTQTGGAGGSRRRAVRRWNRPGPARILAARA